MRNLQIEHAPIAALKPSANNARTHSKKQIRQIAQSIEKFGFNNPILVDDQSCIVAGNGRFEAAKLLGLSHVPAVSLSHRAITTSALTSSPTTSSRKKPVGITTSLPSNCRS